MPQQRVVELDALADQPFAVIDQQPQVELRSVQVRGREGLKALLQRGARDVERVDRIGLATLAGALACLGLSVEVCVVVVTDSAVVAGKDTDDHQDHL
jgi:hypothetical protein